MDRNQIIEEYERRERESGGLAHCDVKAIADKMAEDMNIPREDIVEVLIMHWVKGFG